MTTINVQAMTSEIKQIASLSGNKHACERQGYPILLLRKSALHKKWLSTEHCADIPKLDNREPSESLDDHNYVLRTLREGYVYILAGTESKKEYVGYYEVAEGGILREKPPEDLELDKALPLPDSCVVDNHYVPASFIHTDISDKALAEKPYLWIAYSRYAWNKETLDHYQNGGDLSRFSQVDLAAFSKQPATHPRGIELPSQSTKSIFATLPILEFMQVIPNKINYLPNFKKLYNKWQDFISFVTGAESKTQKKIGAIVLEDPLGMLEDLNFQRNVNVNYTGIAELGDKTNQDSPEIPYTYNPLFSEEYIHKKAIAELIVNYEEQKRKHYQENSVAGEVFVSSVENTWNHLHGKKWQYGGESELFDQTGSIRYKLSQPEKAAYDFDQYWNKLKSQLKDGALESFKQAYQQREKDTEAEQLNAPRDYVRYLRWFFGKQGNRSFYLSGQKITIQSLISSDDENTGTEVTLPTQDIATYNQVKFWEREIDYSSFSHHQQFLSDLTALMSGPTESYYVLGAWEELIKDKDSVLYHASAGKQTDFWSSSNSQSISGKLFSFFTADEGKLMEFFASNLITKMAEAVNQMFRVNPDIARPYFTQILQTHSIEVILARHNIAITEVSVSIQAKDVDKITDKFPQAKTQGTATKGSDIVKLTLLLQGDDESTRRLFKYLNNYHDSAVSANKFITKTEGMIGVTDATVHSMNPKIPVSLFTSNLADAADDIGNLAQYLNTSNQLFNENAIKATTDISKHSAIAMGNILLLLWQGSTLQDNLKSLDKAGLSEEEQAKLKWNLGLGYASAGLTTLKIYGELATGLGKYTGSLLAAGSSLGNAAEKLGAKALTNLVSKNLYRISSSLTGVGIVIGVKDIVYGSLDINKGYKTSGWFMVASGIFSILASFTFFTGPLGIIISLVFVGLSILFAVLSTIYTLTPMQKWFDRCAFGLNKVNDGDLQKFPLTVVGLKQALNEFRVCALGMDVNLVLQYESLIGLFDYGEPTVHLVMSVPGFNPEAGYYEAQFIINDSTNNKQVSILMQGAAAGAKIVSSNVLNNSSAAYQVGEHSQNQSLPHASQNSVITAKSNPIVKDNTLIQTSPDIILYTDGKLINDKEALVYSLDQEQKIDILDANGNVEKQQTVGMFKLSQKIVQLPSTNGLQVKLIFAYYPTGDKKSSPIMLEQKIETSSFLNKVGQSSYDTYMQNPTYTF